MKHKSNPGEILVLSNPRRHGGRRKHAARRRRNPSGFGGGLVGSAISIVKAGAIGAAGALANDVAYGFGKKFLPDALQSGWGRTGTKLASAVVLGMALNKLFPGKGRELAAGAATVTLHEAFSGLANQMAPALPLGAYEDNLLGFDEGDRVGAYMQSAQRVGAYMPAAGVGDIGGSDAAE